MTKPRSKTPELLKGVIDDGHFNTKGVILKDGHLHRFCRPTLISEGLNCGLEGFQDLANGEYGYHTLVDDEECYFTVMDAERHGQRYYKTGNLNYQTSAANRVMIHHMANVMGLNAPNNILCTSTPIERYIVNGEVNRGYLSNRTKNITQPVQCHNGAIQLKSPISEHTEMPEGYAAYFDMLIKMNISNGRVTSFTKNELVATQDLLFIDIGGQSIDIAIVSRNKLTADSFSIEESGMLAIHDFLRSALRDYRSSYATAELNRIIQTRKFQPSLSSENVVDVSDVVNKAIHSTLTSALTRIEHSINFNDYHGVYGLGGAMDLIGKEIQARIPNLTIMDDPLFANSIGALKYLEVIYRPSNEDLLQMVLEARRAA
ncbi:ParM/StbA family protein [Aliagarivorans taiwanensis]|uniref:ParM/StbA family protein n=1 Tax=Aliagarivorans taiwanensis TaxID=561966 RepID=UPI00047D3394|nr:ParM/StbA family protein [Aliagarivorans taiwanensis]